MSFTYKGLEATKKTHQVTPEEVKEQMNRLLQNRLRITPVTDRKSQNGDELLLDYAGFCGTEQFQGGTAENQTLTLGSGTFIPGFEEQLVGCSAGDRVTVKVTFPEQYHAENLAGREAEFRCTVHEVREKSKYEMDATFAKEVGGCDTVAQMEEKMGRSMQYYQNEEAEIQLQDALLKQAAATLELEITPEQLKAAVEEQLQQVRGQLQQQGLSLELYCQFMQTTEEKLREKAEPAARESLQTAAAIEKIAALENLKAEPAELESAREHICQRNGITMEQLKAMNDPNLEAMVERAVLTSKVMGLIRQEAHITEE